LPFAENALQLSNSPLSKFEPGARNEFLDRARDEHLARLRLVRDPCADTDSSRNACSKRAAPTGWRASRWLQRRRRRSRPLRASGEELPAAIVAHGDVA